MVLGCVLGLWRLTRARALNGGPLHQLRRLFRRIARPDNGHEAQAVFLFILVCLLFFRLLLAVFQHLVTICLINLRQGYDLLF
jgi:hypothetical protein